MAKEKKEKKDKSSKKSKIEEPVSDSSTRISKKEKKDKKVSAKLRTPDAASALLDALEEKKPVAETAKKGTSDAVVASEAIAEVVGAHIVPASDLIVPFAQPLAEDKQAKKVLRCVKKGAKNKCLKRGVKEVVKALRKSPAAAAGAAVTSNGLVVLAADISPMDVISHIPVLCEDHGIPYIFVTSRAELGAAGATKRPTSVIMAMPGKKSNKGDDDGFKEAYDEAIKVVESAQKEVVY
ncbi:50S ribosomal protein L30e-like protein [Sphaerosporella brunnea]|uniref:50S ribosomal protein L30e-like protein n=1 Tax=Sphaerosporella brunnea TaxID=1250544 RepID=A0A5J5EJY8_9PEZI|nr:50S ribosomal protein L30e-like protein [Sphaerosporella brunnea]